MSESVNLFHILGLRYEIFHTRMLLWLWSPEQNHGAGRRYVDAFLRAIAVEPCGPLSIRNETGISVEKGGSLRIPDLELMTDTDLILLENKVDPLYQDVEQVRGEIKAGQARAAELGRRFSFVYLAPGPLSRVIAAELTSNGHFISWEELIVLIEGIDTDDLSWRTRDLIKQYTEFLRSPNLGSFSVLQDRTSVDAICGIESLLATRMVGSEFTVADIWRDFSIAYSDLREALEIKFQATAGYKATNWFAQTLAGMAKRQILITDAGKTTLVPVAEWPYSPVRVYRKIVG